MAEFTSPYDALNSITSLYRNLPFKEWMNFTDTLITKIQPIFDYYRLTTQEISSKVVGVLAQVIFSLYRKTITQEKFEKIIADAFSLRDSLFTTFAVTSPEDLQSILKTGK